ncbi:VOC family protein [Noviherbaspirillum sp.]|uniref:VOC family protein n=1 Tax=Noviherbaspirillum sp. TaxID=1926288 RepID=UPI002D3AAED9|nr:VOC family protein [Noviherbaspirillum sp.]HZW23093.1 VOC family protein [Noviherbaspirillum sp.]
MRVLVNIDVPELEPAIRFYTAALGLTHSRTMDGEVAELTGANTVIYLLQNPPGSRFAGGVPEGRDYGRHWTPVHMDFVVEDVFAAAQRAEAAGAVRESECVEWNGSSCISFSDPFGHGFCLIAFEAGTYANSEP